MRTILCNDCGNIATRFQNECGVCSRTNLSFFPGVNSAELQARIREIKGDTNNLRNKLVILSFIGIVFLVMAFHYHHAAALHAIVNSPATPQAVQTAASDSTVSQ